MEKKVFMKVDNFIKAVEITFSMYYIFNLSYPKENCQLLELVQRYFAKINPDQGSRSKKSKNRVITLMKKLTDF